jgi:ATP-dependent Lon protease
VTNQKLKIPKIAHEDFYLNNYIRVFTKHSGVRRYYKKKYNKRFRKIMKKELNFEVDACLSLGF